MSGQPAMFKVSCSGTKRFLDRTKHQGCVKEPGKFMARQRLIFGD